MDAPEVVRIAAFGYKLPPSATTDQRVAVVTEFSTKLAEVRAGTRSWAELAEVSDTARVARLFEGQTFEEGQLIPAMAEVVFKAEVGVACEPVLVGDVLYGMILLGKEKGAAEAPPFEEVKNNLMDQVFMQKIEAAENQWYAAARRKAAITRMVGIEPDPI
jgi:parvulin-like peptidyl-prolyl isomerase